MYSQSKELDFRIKSILEKIKGLLENVPELDVIGAKDIALRQHFHWMGWRPGTNDWFEQGYGTLSTDVEAVLGDALRDLNPMSVVMVQTHKRMTNANLVMKWNDELAESRDDEYQLVNKAIETVTARRK